MQDQAFLGPESGLAVPALRSAKTRRPETETPTCAA